MHGCSQQRCQGQIIVKSEINYNGCGSRRGDTTMAPNNSFTVATSLWASFRFTFNRKLRMPKSGTTPLSSSASYNA